MKMSGKGKQTIRKSGGKPTTKQAATKAKESGKPKQDSAAPSTSSAPAGVPSTSADTSDSKDLALSFPLLKISDNARILPRYTAILARSEEDGVCMEDLDNLQLELEALLSAAALRIRALKGEVGALNTAEEKKDKKSKASTSKPPSPGKRGGGKNQDDRSVKKSKDMAGRAVEVPATPLQIKFTKVKNLPSTAGFKESNALLPDIDIMDTGHSEAPAPSAPKNDAPNKFWAAVEPYCAEISTADIQVIKDLIQSQESQTANLSIPPLGKHYSTTWLKEEVNEEALASNVGADKKKRGATNQLDISETTAKLKKGERRSDAAAPGGLTQRVVCALLEENLMPSKDNMDDKDTKDGENITPGRMKLSNGLTMSNAANLELQVRKELQEQGLLDADDEFPKDDDDEILTELKRCQEELKRVSQHNVAALKKLLAQANEEMIRQDLRRKLSLIDNQVVDAYKKITLAKYKKKPLSKKDKEPAWKILKERDAIIRQLEATSSRAHK